MEPIIEKGTSSNQPVAGGEKISRLSEDMHRALVTGHMLSEQLKALENSKASESTTPVSLIGDLVHSAVYSGVQTPAIGLSQFVDRRLADAVNIMSAPQPAEFGTLQWHAQVIGQAAGMVLPFMLTPGRRRRRKRDDIALEVIITSKSGHPTATELLVYG